MDCQHSSLHLLRRTGQSFAYVTTVYVGPFAAVIWRRGKTSHCMFKCPKTISSMKIAIHPRFPIFYWFHFCYPLLAFSWCLCAPQDISSMAFFAFIFCFWITMFSLVSLEVWMRFGYVIVFNSFYFILIVFYLPVMGIEHKNVGFTSSYSQN